MRDRVLVRPRFLCPLLTIATLKGADRVLGDGSRGCPRFPFCWRPGVGGVKSPKIRGVVKILNFQGPLKLTAFYRVSIENRHLEVKSPSFRGATFGASSPPPSSVRYVLTPPIPVSDFGISRRRGESKRGWREGVAV